jgi:hypothetical protein
MRGELVKRRGKGRGEGHDGGREEGRTRGWWVDGRMRESVDGRKGRKGGREDERGDAR